MVDQQLAALLFSATIFMVYPAGITSAAFVGVGAGTAGAEVD